MLREVAGAYGIDVHPLRPDQVIELGAAGARADRIELLDSRQREELAYWIGGDRPAGTGVPDSALTDRPSGGPVPGRKDDLLGFAYGQIEATGASSPEKLTELYYRAQVSEQIALTPVVQYLINPLGDRDQHNVMVFGLRSQILF